MSDIITLNVGGTIYTTSRTTLTRYPTSMLGCMFSDRLPSTVDKSGNYVIDRDGKLFRYVLNFLRSSKLTLPENFKEYELLAVEADFYQIPELIKAVLENKTSDMSKRKKGDIVVEKRRLMLNNTEAWDWTIYGNRQTIVNLHEALMASAGSRDQNKDEGCGRYHYSEGEGVQSGKLRIKQYVLSNDSSGLVFRDRSQFGLLRGIYRELLIKLWTLGYRLKDIKPEVSTELGDVGSGVQNIIRVESGETFYFEPSSVSVDFQM